MKLSSRKNRCRTHLHHAPSERRRQTIKYLMRYRAELKAEGKVPNYSLAIPYKRSYFHHGVSKGKYTSIILGQKLADGIYKTANREGFMRKYLLRTDDEQSAAVANPQFKMRVRLTND
jgi:hypothetical protein